MAKVFPNLYRLHQVFHRDLFKDQHYFYCSLTTSHFSRNTASMTYADDATFHTHSNNEMTIEHHLQTDGNIAKTWGKENKMHIHYIKTTCMIAGTRHMLHDISPLNLKIDGHDMKNVFQQKLLGLLIDDKLTWSAHIDNICSTLSSKISLLRHLSNYVPTDVLKKFYLGYILPLIDYGSITWSGTSSANIERILKLQKRATRVILHAD